MQTIRARFDGEIFVPLGPVNLKEPMDVLLSVREKADRAETKESDEAIPFWKLPEKERVKIAYKEYKEEFPDSEPDMDLLKLVGILPPMTDEEIKESYYQHLLRKHVK
ncbi:DUF104 domain-containing protein [bacterium]|nr:DUF104 domain-containing protein [bacterium]MBU1613677.1 DUF104 domain-containing protein [bacterium]